MILYISVINKPKRSLQPLKTVFVYLVITALCIIFNNVYTLYGHNVFSDSMTYMYFYPLLGGVLPFFFLWLFTPRCANARYYRFFYNCYNSGIATLTVGSALYGIFEIAGTSSPYSIYFTICGGVLLFIALVAYLSNLCFGQNNGNSNSHPITH